MSYSFWEAPEPKSLALVELTRRGRTAEKALVAFDAIFDIARDYEKGDLTLSAAMARLAESLKDVDRDQVEEMLLREAACCRVGSAARLRVHHQKLELEQERHDEETVQKATQERKAARRKAARQDSCQQEAQRESFSRKRQRTEPDKEAAGSIGIQDLV